MAVFSLKATKTIIPGDPGRPSIMLLTYPLISGLSRLRGWPGDSGTVPEEDP